MRLIESDASVMNLLVEKDKIDILLHPDYAASMAKLLLTENNAIGDRSVYLSHMLCDDLKRSRFDRLEWFFSHGVPLRFIMVDGWALAWHRACRVGPLTELRALSQRLDPNALSLSPVLEYWYRLRGDAPPL